MERKQSTTNIKIEPVETGIDRLGKSLQQSQAIMALTTTPIRSRGVSLSTFPPSGIPGVPLNRAVTEFPETKSTGYISARVQDTESHSQCPTVPAKARNGQDWDLLVQWMFLKAQVTLSC